MKKWEYQSIKKGNSIINEYELNSLGENGWELVSFIEYETDTMVYMFQYIFKREKLEELLEI